MDHLTVFLFLAVALTIFFFSFKVPGFVKWLVVGMGVVIGVLWSLLSNKTRKLKEARERIRQEERRQKIEDEQHEKDKAILANEKKVKKASRGSYSDMDIDSFNKL